MCSLEELINKKLDKDKDFINYFLQNWRQPINLKYRSYRAY